MILLKTSCVFLKMKDENDGRRHCQFYIKIIFACIIFAKFFEINVTNICFLYQRCIFFTFLNSNFLLLPFLLINDRLKIFIVKLGTKLLARNPCIGYGRLLWFLSDRIVYHTASILVSRPFLTIAFM